MSDKIAPCLWFDGRAEEAARFYASLLPSSHVDAVHRAPADYPSGKKRLLALMTDRDAAKAERAMQAMLTMKRIDIAAIERAAEGGAVS
jgi:predicted 3-demethylubiquinone-9 3-methyltransferase (glyoxalase superfamily)